MKNKKALGVALVAFAITGICGAVTVNHLVGGFDGLVKAVDYDRVFSMNSRNTTLEEGVLTHTASDQAELKMSVSGEGTAVPGALVSLADGGSITSLTSIRQLRSMQVGFSGTGTLSLHTSRDGESFFEVGALTTDVEVPFTYAPHYFKLVAKGEVSIGAILLNVDCGIGGDPTLSNASYKGTLETYNYSTSEEESISNYVITSKDNSINFRDIDSATGKLAAADITLYPVAYNNPGYVLALDYNDPNPEREWEVSQMGERLVMSGEATDDEGNYIEVSFSGSLYYPAETLEVTVDGTAYSGDTIELKVDNTVSIAATARRSDYRTVTDSIVFEADGTVMSLNSGSGTTRTAKAIADGTGSVTVSCGNLKVVVSFSVKAKEEGQTTIYSLPDSMLSTKWSGSPDPENDFADFVISIGKLNSQIWVEDTYGLVSETLTISNNGKSYSIGETFYHIEFVDGEFMTGLILEFTPNVENPKASVMKASGTFIDYNKTEAPFTDLVLTYTEAE